MRLRHYLRGLGLGIIVSTLIISAGKRGSAAELTDDEIRARAKALGMVEEDEMLLSSARELADEAARKDDERKNAASENVVNDAVSSGTAISSDASEGLENGVIGKLGAGAESALKPGSNGSEDISDNVIRQAEQISAGADKEELVSDAGQGSAVSKTSSSDKKDPEISDKKTTSSSDKKTTSSSDKKTTSSSDKKTTSSSDKKTTSSSDKKTTSSSEKKSQETSPEITPAANETAEPKPEVPEQQPVQEPVSQTVPAGSISIIKGESSTAVARKLQQAGIILDAAQFDQYLCLNGYDRHLVVGDHAIPAGASARDIAEIITHK